AMYDRNVTTLANAPAMLEIRMSRLYTCDSSCPSTARNSRSSSSSRIPVVQQTAEFRGLRPVANAFGADVGLTYSRGIGCRADVANSRTIRYIAGCSASDTGRARIARSASLSELK